MNWQDKPTECGWYAIYDNPRFCTSPRYVIWHCHTATTEKTDSKYPEGNFSKGDLVLGFDDKKDNIPVNDFWTEGRKFIRLPELVNA